MNILVVTQYFNPENFRINDICTSLKEEGHRVTVLTGLPNYPQGKFYQGYTFKSGPYREDYLGIPVFRVPMVPRGMGRSLQLFLNYLSFMIFASMIAPYKLRGLKFDCIFVYQPSPVTVVIPAIVLKFFKRIPIYFWVTDLWPETLNATGVVTNSFALKVIGCAVALMYRRCHRILVTSKGFIPKIQARGVDSSKIIYWPQWGEDMFLNFSAGEKPEEAETKELPIGFRLMFAGNIGTSQSFDTLLDAASELKYLPEIKWIILGDGLDRARVEAEVVKRGLESQFYLLGSKPLEMMPFYYDQSDVLVASLKKDPVFAITVPSKIQSYLPSGKPIIASMDGEGAELVEEAGAGIGCAASDHIELREAVLKLFNMSTEERDEMGRNGRSYFVQHFTRVKLLSQLEDILCH